MVNLWRKRYFRVFPAPDFCISYFKSKEDVTESGASPVPLPLPLAARPLHNVCASACRCSSPLPPLPLLTWRRALCARRAVQVVFRLVAFYWWSRWRA